MRENCGTFNILRQNNSPWWRSLEAFLRFSDKFKENEKGYVRGGEVWKGASRPPPPYCMAPGDSRETENNFKGTNFNHENDSAK